MKKRRGDTVRDKMVQRIDEIEWCSLGDVPRRLRFPFPVTVVGWIITGAVHYRGTHRSFGTEFCVRLRSCDATAVDFVNGVRHECAFPHVMMKRHGERHEYRAQGWREAFYIIYPPGMEAALRRAGVDDGHGALPMWPVGGASYFEETGMNEDTGVVAFDGKRHHIALTLSQSDGKVTASLYKDYNPTPAWTKTKAGRLCYGEGYAPVWIGASSSTTAFFNGQIDELRISRGILAPSEFLRRGNMPFVMMVK